MANASSTATVVTYTVSGTATNGSDYSTLTGSVTIPAGSTTANIAVTVIDDSIVEGNETGSVEHTSELGTPRITVGRSHPATMTITDNDMVSVSIVPAQPSAVVPIANGPSTVTSLSLHDALPILTYTVSGTATNGSDYSTLTGSVTIPAGSTTANIAVTVIDDSIVEGNET